MDFVGAENYWEKYGVFFNSFRPNVKLLLWKLERINDLTSKKLEVISLNLTFLKVADSARVVEYTDCCSA